MRLKSSGRIERQEALAERPGFLASIARLETGSKTHIDDAEEPRKRPQGDGGDWWVRESAREEVATMTREAGGDDWKSEDSTVSTVEAQSITVGRAAVPRASCVHLSDGS
jgi:hypothetical protein